MLEMLFGIVAIVVLLAGMLVWVRLGQLANAQKLVLETIQLQLEEKHRAVLSSMHEGMTRQAESMTNAFGQQSDRLRNSLTESNDRLREGVAQAFDRLREAVAHELRDTRQVLDLARNSQTDAMQALQLSQTQSLAESREAILRQLAEISTAIQQRQDQARSDTVETVGRVLAEQGAAQQELLLTTLRQTTQQLTQSVGEQTQKVDERLEQISGKVSERLEEGFKKTNETFTSVMARLATIDEAQKKIDGLTTNVVSLQELLGDKRSRGAYGEVQLEHLVRNVLPEAAFRLQVTLSNGTRADCLLQLPEPTGKVAVDSKFPLENYHRMFGPDVTETERALAQRAFKADVKRHIDAIGDKYIVPGETSDGAVMFIPAEAVFAEIHAYHPELVQHAMSRRVWIVSPTTMMAVLNTARAVIKDVETRRQVHIIKDALGKLGREFERFDVRMKKLADHIRQAHEDALQVQITSDKISKRFTEIEHVRLDGENQQTLPEPVTSETGLLV